MIQQSRFPPKRTTIAHPELFKITSAISRTRPPVYAYTPSRSLIIGVTSSSVTISYPSSTPRGTESLNTKIDDRNEPLGRLFFYERASGAWRAHPGVIFFRAIFGNATGRLLLLDPYDSVIDFSRELFATKTFATKLVTTQAPKKIIKTCRKEIYIFFTFSYKYVHTSSMIDTHEDYSSSVMGRHQLFEE